MQHVLIHWIICVIVLISCKEPPCIKDEDCSYGCPEDFNGKCTAKCVDKICYAEMTPQAEYFMIDDKTCSSSDDCKCSKEIKGDCYPMCVKDQCNFKIIPGNRKELEHEYNCPKGTTCVDSFGASSKEMENDQQEDENGNVIDSLNKAKPTNKPKATKKPKPTMKPKATKRPKPSKKPGKIRRRRPEVDGRNRQQIFNPVSLKNRQMPRYIDHNYHKNPKKYGNRIIKKQGGPKKYKKKKKAPKAKKTYPREERF